jgi:predicted secreted protein
MPVYIVQTSAKLNQKELDKALDICQATNCDTICINAPKITDFKAYDFISDNLKNYKDNNPDIKFTVRNPKDSKLFALPIPEYRFSNIIDIVKKYDAYVGLDISNIDMDTFENEFTRKIDDYAPYISVIYLSDKTKDGK